MNALHDTALAERLNESGIKDIKCMSKSETTFFVYVHKRKDQFSEKQLGS